jgi:hypothetical protein
VTIQALFGDGEVGEIEEEVIETTTSYSPVVPKIPNEFQSPSQSPPVTRPTVIAANTSGNTSKPSSLASSFIHAGDSKRSREFAPLSPSPPMATTLPSVAAATSSRYGSGSGMSTGGVSPLTTSTASLGPRFRTAAPLSQPLNTNISTSSTATTRSGGIQVPSSDRYLLSSSPPSIAAQTRYGTTPNNSISLSSSLPPSTSNYGAFSATTSMNRPSLSSFSPNVPPPPSPLTSSIYNSTGPSSSSLRQRAVAPFTSLTSSDSYAGATPVPSVAAPIPKASPIPSPIPSRSEPVIILMCHSHT